MDIFYVIEYTYRHSAGSWETGAITVMGETELKSTLEELIPRITRLDLVLTRIYVA